MLKIQILTLFYFSIYCSNKHVNNFLKYNDYVKKLGWNKY